MKTREIRGPAVVDIVSNSLRVTMKDRSANIEFACEGKTCVVALDSLTHWAPPRQDQEIAIEDLLIILRTLEAEFARRGLDAEFD